MVRIKQIIEKFFSQNVDNETKRLFAEWLSAPVDKELKDSVLMEQWEKECYLSPGDMSKSYTAVEKKIRRSDSKPVGRFIPWVWAGVASAACIALAIFLKAPVVQPTLESSHIKMLECYVGNGEKQVITMSDSTTVILNSGSVLIYPENFGADEREVYLTGEAIFDVTKDASHPFIVKTSDFSIKVLGTLFNVCSYPEADYSSATLKEGSISLSADGKDAWLLSPNQTLNYSRTTHKVSIEQADMDDAFGWKDGKLCFKSASIHQIIKSIERHYGVRVYLTTGKYDNEFVTAKFIYGESVDELFSALSLVIPGMRYTVENNAVYIR